MRRRSLIYSLVLVLASVKTHKEAEKDGSSSSSRSSTTGEMVDEENYKIETIAREEDRQNSTYALR